MNPTHTATAPKEVALDIFEELKSGEIDKAVARFADKFRFNDFGSGLEFSDKDRLAEFFQKTREFYPDSVLVVDTIFVSGNHVVAEWTLRAMSELSYGDRSQRVPIILRGATVARTEDGKITQWSEYYDGITARRSALASYFTEWVEL